MIQNTFCHIPGIGLGSERRLWEGGITSWQAVTPEGLKRMRRERRERIVRLSQESIEQHSARNAGYFADRLPANETWRLFPDFENQAAFLDIETTGLNGARDCITTIALYDGLRVYHFVRGENLDEFAERIAEYKVIVTFNGKTFDVPFIRRHLGVPMPHAHIDLRFVLRSLGQRGGLKACEKRLGLDRKELADVDGFFAVLLWQDYQRTGDRRSLETLLAYNMADVVNLAVMMPMVYNMKIGETPFAESRRMPAAVPPAIPFRADRETIERIRREWGG